MAPAIRANVSRSKRLALPTLFTLVLRARARVLPLGVGFLGVVASTMVVANPASAQSSIPAAQCASILHRMGVPSGAHCALSERPTGKGLVKVTVTVTGRGEVRSVAAPEASSSVPTISPIPVPQVRPTALPAASGSAIGFCPNTVFGTNCCVNFYAEPKAATWSLQFSFFSTAFVLEFLPPLTGDCQATFCSYSEVGGGGGALPYAWTLESTNMIALVGITKTYQC